MYDNTPTHSYLSRWQQPPEDSLCSSSFRRLYVDWIGQSPPVARWWLYVSRTRRHPDASFHGRIIPTYSIAFFTSRGGVCEYPLCLGVCLLTVAFLLCECYAVLCLCWIVLCLCMPNHKYIWWWLWKSTIFDFTKIAWLSSWTPVCVFSYDDSCGMRMCKSAKDHQDISHYLYHVGCSCHNAKNPIGG